MKNGRKTVFSILLCLCMVLQFAPSAAFAVGADDPCAHPSYSTVSVPETCTAQGYDIHSCTACDYSYIEYHSYSEWSAERPTGIDDALIQTATQYRSADKDIKISGESAIDGYTLVEKVWDIGSQETNDYAVFTGTGFSATNALYEQYSHPVSASEDETRKIVLDSEAKTGYLYYHWCYPNSYYAVEVSSGSYTTFHAYYDTTSPNTYTCDTSDMSYKTSHSSCSNSDWWFVLDVNTQSYTVYDRVNVFKKLGDWSAWDFAEIQPTDTCEVETREVYRYANGTPSHDFGTDGICTVCREACTHTGGKASCKKQAVCGTCGASYGELAEHTPDTNGKCTVDGCGYQYAAKVGDSFYETIHKALRAAEGINGCTLTLLDDVTLTSMSNYASYVNTGTFTLDLNGKTLSSNKSTLEVMGSADLTIRDGIGSGKIVSTGGSAVYLSGGKLTIESGAFEGSLYGVFVSGNYSTVTAIIKGGTFSGSQAMITGFGSNCVIDLTAIDPSGLTLKNNGSGTFAPKLPEGYGMVGSDGKLLSSLSAEQSATVHKHEYQYTDIGDGKHQQACSCGLTTGEPAAHSTTAEDDKAATCIAPAYCSVCDSEYGEVDKTNHVSENYTYTDNGDGTHAATCSGCDFSKTEPHAMDAATGKCVCGVDMAVAAVTIGGIDTYYETLKDAIAAAAVGAKDAPATVTVLKNIDITETIQVSSGVFTLNLNGKTLRDYKGNGLFDGIFSLPSDSTAHMTIADAAGGKLLADWRVVEVHGGTVTITGGNLSYAGATILGNSVSAYGGTLNISGGTIDGIGAHFGTTVNISGGSIESIHLSEHITANISGGSIMHLWVESAESNVKLSGGEFMTVDCREKKISELLVDGYSYWTLDGTTMLNPEYDTDLNNVIVKATCLHPAEKLTYVTSDSSTHTWECSDCNNNITEAHTEPPTYTLTADGAQHVATWSCCGNTVTGPHSLALTYVNLDADGHKAYYPCCQQAGDVEATGHEYENGCCVCTDVKEFTLSFYASDGDETPVATFSVPYGTELIRWEEDEDDNVTFLGATDYLNALIGQVDTSTLKKEHYTFRSWDLENGPESMYKDESIFGIWDPVSYGITWDLAGGYAQYPEELPTVYDYGYGPMLWTGFAREGYTLSHFTDQYGQAYTLHERSDHYSMEPILPGGNLTLTAVWDVNAYILHAQDQSLDVDYGTALTDALSGIAPEKTGYTLTGWKFYLDEGCTEEYTGTTMPAYSVYAQPAFEPIQYNITWELNGCTVDSYVSRALPETLPYNGDADHKHQVKVFLNAPEGYTFMGFRDGNGNVLEYSAANSWLFLTVTGDMTIEAIVEPNTYMATWDNGDGGSYDVGVKYGEVITVPTSEFFQDTFRKAGYTLVGWEGYTEGMTMPIGGVTIKAKWHINPASLAVPSGKYTGEAHAPAVTVAGLTEGEDFTVSYPADMTNVGEKIITVSGKHGGSVTVTYTIEKADPPVITFPEVLNSITYGQMLEDAKLSFYENEYGTFNWTAPIGVPNAGTNGYALDFYPEDLTNYDWAACNWQTHNATWIESRSALCAMGQVQVDKAEPVYTAPTAIEGLVYTGSSQELISVSEVQVEGGELLLSRDGNIYSQNLPAETDAGEYTVWYYVRGDDNHNDSAKKSVSVTIARKELTATVSGSMSKSYDGTNAVPERHSLNIVLNGVISGDTVTASADFAFAGVNAGTTTINATNIALSGKDAANYELKATTASADVGEIVVLDLQYLEPHDYDIVFGTGPVYNGKEQTMTVESFVMCGMDVTYEVTGNTGTEAGTYTMTVTATGNFAGTVEEGWQITRKPVTITAKDQTVTYGSAISGAEIASVGLIDGHSVTATLTPSTANVTANGSITASAAVITADGADVTANYEITYADGKLVIEPDTSGIDDLTAENVTSANEADIKAVQEMLENADSVKDEWAATDDKCSQLLDRIDEVEAEQKELTDAAADFDPDTVKSTEKEDLEQLAEDIEALLDTENLTEDERGGLETVLEQVNDMIDTVEDAAEASKDATEAIDARDPATVTSADEDELEQAIGTIDKLLQDGHLTEEERNALEDAKAEAEALIDVIEKAQDAASTENTEKVENVTPENVKPEDKADLEKAKTDLEKALEDNGGNYTEEEKKSVEDEIDRIEAAVAALKNAEDVTASIAQLPESVEPDDEAAAGKILAAKEAFDGLTDHEKSLVDEASREKLDELVAALIAYDIIKGDGSEWIKGSDGSLSFTANGPFSKFVGIEVDGEEVDAKHYEAKSGSTIITLKQSFLMNLAAGEHTLTVIYTDGETSGTFRIHTKSLTPTTGDDSRILLYASMLTVSLAALAVLLPAARKRKKENS